MQTKVIKLIGPTEDDLEKIRAAGACVDRGLLVAFPTETVYGIACRAETSSIAKLDAVKQRSREKRYTLHIAAKDDAADYVPNIPPMG